MRRKRRARSAFTVLSLVMAVTVTLGSFMAFADESSDWQKQNQDQGPISSQINLLDKTGEQNLWGSLIGGSIQTSMGMSGEQQLGVSNYKISYSEPPIGYSMTITYEAQEADDPQLGSSGVSAAATTVTVQDGDEVPEDTELSIAVDVDIEEAAIGIFSVLVNDVALTNEITDILEFKFRGQHTVTEDSEIVIEPTVLSFAPMSINLNTITVDATSMSNTSWVFVNTTGSGPSSYYHNYRCSNNCGVTTSVGPTTVTVTAPGGAPHTQIQCDVRRWHNTYGGSTLNVEFNNPAAGGTAALLTAITSSTGTGTTINRPTTLNFTGAGSSVSGSTNTANQPDVPINMVNAVAALNASGTRTLTFDHVDVSTAGTPTISGSAANPMTVSFTNYGQQPGGVNPPTQAEITGGGTIIVNQYGTLDSTGSIYFAGNPTITVGGGTVSGTFTNTGPININSGLVDGSIQGGTGALTMTGGTVTGTAMGAATSTVTGGTINGGTVGTSVGDLTLTNTTTVLTNATLLARAGRVTLQAGQIGSITSIEAQTVTIPAGGTTLTIGTISCLGSGTSTVSNSAGTIYVGGNTMTLNNSIAVTTVYLGSNRGNTTGTSTLNVNPAQIGTIYGGTNSATYTVAASQINIQATSGSGVGTVYLGGNNANAGLITTSSLLQTGGTVGTIYGGGSLGGTVNTANITINSGSTVTGNIYGGGLAGTVGTASNTTGARININSAVGGNVYGGGTSGNVTHAVINVAANVNGAIGVHGGSAGTGQITQKTTINLSSGTVTGNVFGGGAGNGSTLESEINYTGGVINGPLGILGGGSASNMTTTARVNINANISNPTNLTNPSAKIYGGGSVGNVGTSYVNVNAGFSVTGTPVYGGSADTGTTGTTNVNIAGTVGTGAAPQNVYGGGAGTGGVTVTTNVYGPTPITGVVNGNVYGGGTGTGVVARSNVTGPFTVNGTVFGGGFGAGTTVTAANVIVDAGTYNRDIFGGGEDGSYTDTAIVDISGAATVTSPYTIYGGGDKDSTCRTTQVIIGINLPNRSVYGGGRDSVVTGDTNIEIRNNGGTYAGSVQNVFGGGQETTTHAGTAVVQGTTHVVINGTNPSTPTTVTNNVYGGGDSSNVLHTDVIVRDGTVTNNVYGGGKDLTIPNTKAYVTGNTKVEITATGVVTNNVYGGGDSDGNNVNTTASGTRTDVIISAGGNVKGSVFGGGLDSTAKATNVTVTGATTLVENNVYGGGSSTGAALTTASVTGTNVTVSGGQIGLAAGADGNVFGGGNNTVSAAAGRAPVNGSTSVTISGGNVGRDSSTDRTASVFGGGENNPVTGTTKVEITSTGTVWRDVFGGGLDVNGIVGIAGNSAPLVSEVIISGGTVKGGTANGGATFTTTTYTTTIGGGVYGGGYANNGGANDAIVYGQTRVTMTGGIVETNIFGGGLRAVVNGNANVILNGTGTVQTNVYGGGRDDNADVRGANGTRIEILNGTVLHNVYGGGYDHALVINNTYVQIDDKVGISAPSGRPSAAVPVLGTDDVVFGGGTGASGTTVGGSTHVVVGLTKAALINADVHGGGDGIGNNVNGSGGAWVEILSGTINGNVFGGGHDSTVQKTVIDHKATVNGTIWGGGVSRSVSNANVTTGGVTITLDGGQVINGGNVNGGGVSTNNQNANVTSTTQPAVSITIKGNSDVYGSVFGGGEAWTANGIADIFNNVRILIEGNSRIRTDVFGGGHHDGSTVTPRQATVRGNVDMTLDGNTQVDRNVYGGGIDNPIIGTVNILTKGSTEIRGTLHGGGKGTTSSNETDATVNQSNANEAVVVTITLDENTHILGNVYGGGDFGHVYGSIRLNALSGNFDRNIYGGGQNGNVEWNTFVLVEAAATVGHSVYGGGIMDDPLKPYPANDSNTYWVRGYTDVTINGNILGSVYGGGHRMDVQNLGNYTNRGATVRINTNAVIGDSAPPSNTDERGTVYGGGRDANISNLLFGGTFVYLNGGAQVLWDVYGGGWNETVTIPANTPSTHGIVAGPQGTFVQLNGTSWVNHNVYGGGRNFGDVVHVNAGGTVVELNDHCVVGNPTPGERGDVYGGGNKGHIWGLNGTKVTLNPYATVYGTIYGGCYYSDVKHANAGTKVYIYGQVGDTYHTKDYIEPTSNDPRPSFYDGDVDFYGNPTAKTGNVYGGGNHGDVLGDKGTYMEVTDRPAGTNNGRAVVWNSAYGGGLEGIVQFNTVVKIFGGSEVYNSVFGGGQQSQASSAQAAHVFGTTTVQVTEPDTKIGHPGVTDLTDNLGITGGRANHSDPSFNNNNDLELHAGRIFGGGDYATVGGASTVTVTDLAQIAFRTISGGSFGVNSTNNAAGRTVNLNNLGNGQGTANPYDDLSVYTVIKHLCDYTRANADNCYLTVYYHLRSTDDNSDHGLAYPGYYPKDSMEYRSEFRSTGGKYHAWRPYPHKDIIIDPLMMMRDTMFRMEAGYTIDMRPGGHANVGLNKTELLIDRDHYRLTATSKVYGPSNVVVDPTSFNYNYLPNTLYPKNLIDRVSTAVCGISFYIPPIEIKTVDGDSTSFGGTDKLDQTTGNTGSPVYEATDRTVSVRASEKELVGKVKEALDKTAKGKTAYVSETRYDQVTSEVLSAVGKAAVAANGKAILMFDTLNGNSVQGRLYIDPSKQLPASPLNTRVYTVAGRVAQAKVNFEKHYKNNFAFVQLGQTNPFGVEVEIAAKVNLEKLDTKNLIFYAYSESTNSYKRIQNPRYFIDKNGYLHFYTAVGGTIVITDKPLAWK